MDNRLSNLRYVTTADNSKNSDRAAPLQCPYDGVVWKNDKLRKPWRWSVTLKDGTRKFMTYHATPEEARDARAAWIEANRDLVHDRVT